MSGTDILVFSIHKERMCVLGPGPSNIIMVGNALTFLVSLLFTNKKIDISSLNICLYILDYGEKTTIRKEGG